MGSRYQPIENYGVIGNLRTAALVGMDGSIDWLCLPHFDSPSVFAAILDDQKGGRFRIAPAGENFRRKQFYWPGTAVMITRFLHNSAGMVGLVWIGIVVFVVTLIVVRDVRIFARYRYIALLLGLMFMLLPLAPGIGNDASLRPNQIFAVSLPVSSRNAPRAAR